MFLLGHGDRDMVELNRETTRKFLPRLYTSRIYFSYLVMAPSWNSLLSSFFTQLGNKIFFLSLFTQTVFSVFENKLYAKETF